MVTLRTKVAFAALVAAQAAHSVEEYTGRLWETFPPAMFLTGLFPSRETGFLIINVALVAFGVWSALWPVRCDWRVARGVIWFWIVISMINAVGHPGWSLAQGRYTAGVVTAPILGGLALYLMVRLRRDGRAPVR